MYLLRVPKIRSAALIAVVMAQPAHFVALAGFIPAKQSHVAKLRNFRIMIVDNGF